MRRRPDRAGLVLVSLILVAAVANLNLAVANVALPDIGAAFDSSQTTLNLIAVGYSLGLAASVLYLGALGDRYGRKLMLILGMALSVPACLLAAWAPSRRGALRRPPARRALRRHGVPDDARPDHRAVVRARAGRSRSRCGRRIGGAISALGPLVAGALLEHFWWGSVFLVTLPLAAVALVLAVRARAEPRQRDDRPGRQPRRHPVGRARRRRSILAINFAPVPDKGALALGLAAIALAGADRVPPPPAPRREPALRPRRRRPPHLLGRRLRRASSCSAR